MGDIPRPPWHNRHILYTQGDRFYITGLYGVPWYCVLHTCRGCDNHRRDNSCSQQRPQESWRRATDGYDAEGDPDDYPDGYSDDYRDQGYANYPSPSQGQGAMPGEAEGPGSSSAPMTVDAAAPDSTGNPANAAR